MKLNSDNSLFSNKIINTITAYSDEFIEINKVRYSHSVLFNTNSSITRWPVSSVKNVTSKLLWMACELELSRSSCNISNSSEVVITSEIKRPPEILLIGTGIYHEFLEFHKLSEILQFGIGIETMSTRAAARTYNILSAEGRHVVVALILAYENIII